MPGINAIYDEHDPEDLPPELQPLPDVDWGELSSRAVQWLVDKLPDEMLVDAPGDNRLMKGVLAGGIGIHFDDEVVPCGEPLHLRAIVWPPASIDVLADLARYARAPPLPTASAP